MSKRRFALVVMLGFLSGCACLTYRTPSGTCGSYCRVGTQQLQGLEVAVDNRTVVKLDSSNADSKDTIVALTQLTSDIARASVK